MHLNNCCFINYINKTVKLIFKIVTNITEKPNHITPQHPYKDKKVDSLNDDVVDRAFRLDAMKRKIQSAGLQPR